MKMLRVLALLLALCLLAAPAALADLKSGDLFVDPMSGASFTVPKGWREYDVEQDEHNYFLSLDIAETKNMIFFFCSDLGSQLQAEGLNVPRATINNENYFSPEDAAEFMDVDVADLKIMTFNGLEFYTSESITYEYGQKEHVYAAMCCHNGYLYYVDFTGPDLSYMPAVVELLETFRP